MYGWGLDSSALLVLQELVLRAAAENGRLVRYTLYWIGSLFEHVSLHGLRWIVVSLHRMAVLVVLYLGTLLAKNLVVQGAQILVVAVESMVDSLGFVASIGDTLHSRKAVIGLV